MKIEIDRSQLTQVKTLLAGVKSGSNKVLSRAINKALTGTKSAAKKEITKHYNITQKNIDKNFVLTKSSWNRPIGRVDSRGGPKSLTSFKGTRMIKAGVSVMVLKATGRKTIKHAFLATKNNSSQAYWRKTVHGRPFRKGFPYGILPVKYRYPV